MAKRVHNKAQRAEHYRLNAERIKAYGRCYKLAHKDRLNAKYRAFKKANKALFARKRAYYRASKLQRTPPWLTKEHLEQIKLFYEAAAFMTAELGIRFVVDHIIPLKGKEISGLHVPWNLQVISEQENLRKNNKVYL